AQREYDEAPYIKIDVWRFTVKRAGARFGGQGCPRSRQASFASVCRARLLKCFGSPASISTSNGET
ncbi:MAG TPA: hypothetical protein VF297_09570, partial [Pyrinomonadaceae bacterium]